MMEASEIVEKYADQIVAAVRDVAPEVWEAAVQAVLAGAWVGICVALVVLVAGILAARWASKADLDDGDRTGATLTILCITVGALALLGRYAYILLGGWRWEAMQNIAGLVKPG